MLFNLNGFAALTDGNRESSTISGGKKRWYNLYKSILLLISGGEIPMELRQYSRSAMDVPHPDGTIAFVLANGYITYGSQPPSKENSKLVLEVATLSPVPGLPADGGDFESYEGTVPELDGMQVFCSGTVQATSLSAFEKGNDIAPSRAFTLRVCDYVRGAPQVSVLLCFLPRGNARWNSMTLPVEHSNVSVVGVLDHQRDDGTLAVKVLSIAFLGTSTNAASVGGGQLPAANGGTKKRKFPTRLSANNTSVPVATVAAPAVASTSATAGPSAQGTEQQQEQAPVVAKTGPSETGEETHGGTDQFTSAEDMADDPTVAGTDKRKRARR